VTPPRDRVSTAQGRIIIAGTGRTGTTFLVQLFTALGFGTGFSLEESLSGVDDVSHAGLEKALVDEANPYVIKSPWFADHLGEALHDERIKIYAAILPFRDLYSAAESRRRVYREAGRRGLDPIAQWGSLSHTDTPDNQEEALARQFYKTIFPLLQSEVPTYFPEFPRLVHDPDYLFRKLEPLMSDHGVGHSEFLRAHQSVARPELIHDFGHHPDWAREQARQEYPQREREDARTALADARRTLSEKERLNTELIEHARRVEAQRDEAQTESSRMTADLQLIKAENQELRTAEQAIRAESVSLIAEIESRKLEFESLKAETESLKELSESRRLELESLRSDSEALRPIAQRHEAWSAALGVELHSLWNSRSWRMLKPLRNLARKVRGFDKETPPPFQSESEPLRTIIALRRSISWELLAPVRLIHRILRRRRRSAAAHPIPVNPGAGSRPAADIGAALVGKPATEHRDAKEITKQAFATQLSDFLDVNSVISLPRSERPDVSIILVLYNQAALTFGCLCSIVESLDKSPVGVEVIIADNGSTDRTAELLRKVDGATVLWNETNLGFLRAVNQAATHAEGKHILLLNNDAQLIPGSLEAATRVLEANTDVGAVGGRLILPDGTLQEAGSIVWQDGSTVGYGRGDQPTAPAYMFRREVDYCSGAFLLTSRELFKQLGGFDSAFVPAYYEEADYCMRLWESGFRVVYEPDAVVLHYEFGSSEQTGSALDLQRAHREVFAQKHADKLQSHLAPLVSNLLSARTAGAKRKRILMLEDGIPHTQLGSGYPRSKRIVEELVAAGALVTLFPTVGLAEEWREVRSDVSPEVEVMLGHSIADLEQFLDQRRSFYGAVMVCRPHNMESFLALIGRRPELLADATLIYDAEALFAERDILERQLLGDPLEQAAGEAILAQEASLAGQAKLVLSVSARECAEFRRLGVGRVELLGHTIEPSPGCAVFAQRRDLLFVGRLTEERSPNVDGLAWFAQEILPVIRRNLESEVVLKVVGKLGASSMSNLNCPSVALLGQVRDLAPIYDRARVFIAPTRYAAGVPLKVYEAAAHGVPSVVTPLLAEQLGWCDEKELLVGHDRDSFADQCSRLYRDEVLWTRIRENALDRVRKDCDPVGFRRTIDQIIDATRSS